MLTADVFALTISAAMHAAARTPMPAAFPAGALFTGAFIGGILRARWVRTGHLERVSLRGSPARGDASSSSPPRRFSGYVERRTRTMTSSGITADGDNVPRRAATAVAAPK